MSTSVTAVESILTCTTLTSNKSEKFKVNNSLRD